MLLIFVSYYCLELDANIENVFNFYTDLWRRFLIFYEILLPIAFVYCWFENISKREKLRDFNLSLGSKNESRNLFIRFVKFGVI